MEVKRRDKGGGGGGTTEQVGDKKELFHCND